MTVDKKLLHGIKILLYNLIVFIIDLIDKSYDSNKKLIYSHILDGIEILSENGWSPTAYIHKTKPFDIYTIKTKSGKELKCADEHILYTSDLIPIWAKDLKIGDLLYTIDGFDEVISIEKSDTKVCMCDITVLNKNESYYSNGILSHNTTTSAIFLLHYILFNIDKNSLVLGNARKTAVEILDKVKKIFLELPYFLKPGVYKWNEGQIVLDNGCMCMAEATTINSGISFTFHCVLADEFAHVAPHIIDKFYNNLFPTITAGKARFIISSTQNGYNLFYKLWCGAVEKENEYAPFKVDWWQVPEWNPEKKCWEKRDEAWHRLQIANYGGEENFNKQFGTNFDISANCLVTTKSLKEQMEKAQEFTNKEMPGFIYSKYFFWDPRYDINRLKRDYIVITIDIAEGLGKDYTVFNINRLYYDGNEIITQLVGYFRCNEIECKRCAKILIEFCSRFFVTEDRYIVSVEYNLYGEYFVEMVRKYMDNAPLNQAFSTDVFVKYWNDTRTKYITGVRVNRGNKIAMCKRFKSTFELGRVLTPDTRFLNELTNFSEQGNGTFSCIVGHDDLVMAEIQLEEVNKTLQYKNLCEDVMADQMLMQEIIRDNNKSIKENDEFGPTRPIKIESRTSATTVYDGMTLFEGSTPSNMDEIYRMMGVQFPDRSWGTYNPEQNLYEDPEKEEDFNLKRLR